MDWNNTVVVYTCEDYADEFDVYGFEVGYGEIYEYRIKDFLQYAKILGIEKYEAYFGTNEFITVFATEEDLRRIFQCVKITPEEKDAYSSILRKIGKNADLGQISLTKIVKELKEQVFTQLLDKEEKAMIAASPAHASKE